MDAFSVELAALLAGNAAVPQIKDATAGSSAHVASSTESGHMPVDEESHHGHNTGFFCVVTAEFTP
ncbi:hypothetical protein HDZ31DRAFT_65924 [Schizophyllum fasciatum]